MENTAMFILEGRLVEKNLFERTSVMKLAWGLTFSLSKIQVINLVVKVDYMIIIDEQGDGDHEDHDNLEVHDCRPVQGVP